MIAAADEVIADAASYGDYWNRWLLKDAHSQLCFFHFLRYFADYRPRPLYVGMIIRDEPAKRIVDFVCHRLVTDTGSVLEKAKWFQAYWNSSVAVHGIFEPIRDGVAERYRSHGPTIVRRRIVGPAPS
jgi:hypothetical protein